MTWDNGKAEEAEKLAAQVPSAAELHRQQTEKNEQQAAAHLDRQIRILCVEQASKATAAGGYEVGAILALAKGFYVFLTTK